MTVYFSLVPSTIALKINKKSEARVAGNYWQTKRRTDVCSFTAITTITQIYTASILASELRHARDMGPVSTG